MKYYRLLFCLLLSIPQAVLAEVYEVDGLFDSLVVSTDGSFFRDTPLLLNQGASPVYLQGLLEIEGGQLVGGYLQAEDFTIDANVSSVNTYYELSSAQWVFSEDGTASFSASESCVDYGLSICPSLPATGMLSWFDISVDVVGGDIVLTTETIAYTPIGEVTFSGMQLLTTSFLVTINQPVLNSDGCVEAQNPDGAGVSLVASSTGSAGQLEYLWATSTGLSGTGPEMYVDIPLEGSVSVDLTAFDVESGEEANDTLALCSSDTVAPEIFFLAPVDGDVLHSWGGPLRVKVVDAVDQYIDSVEIYIAESRTINRKRKGVFSSKLSRPIRGESSQMKITADVVDASGNKTEASISVIQQAKPAKR